MPWIDPDQTPVPASFSQAIGGHPLVARMLYQRGFQTLQEALAFINPDHYPPTSPFELPGVSAAVDMLVTAREQNTLVCVWGDFDVDGQTATTALVSGLQHFGIQVQHYIPVRGQETHGLHIESLNSILEAGTKLLLTCDTGISDLAAVTYARSRDVNVIITDHHDLPADLPNANAILNPKQLVPDHPLYPLPGVGVAYLLLKALSERLGEPKFTEGLLDLVALGIVADVAELRGEARFLLQQGLPALRTTNRIGLQTMMKLAELEPASLTEEHIGFVLGPRLNALGRLGNTNPIVKFLTTNNPTEARQFADQLEGLNAKRQLLTEQVLRSALDLIERDPRQLDSEVLVLSHPAWPGGIVGIVANRLAERFQRPVILLCAPEGEPARGSARSIPNIDITHAIAQQSDRLHSFGGHPMAAGLSLDQEDIEPFRHEISRFVALQKAEVHEEPLRVDAFVALNDVDFEFVEAIERMAPFGQGNPPPVLAAHAVRINNHRIIGRSDDHLILNVANGERNAHQVLWWNGAGMPLPEGEFDLAYTARKSTYRGRPKIQIEWIGWRQLQDQPVVFDSGLKMEVIDHRNEIDPQVHLAAIQEVETDVLIWREGMEVERVSGVDRFGVRPAEALVVWTQPGSQDIFKELIDAVQPQRLYLFANNPGYSTMADFSAGLAGLVKYTLQQQDGRLSVEKLSARMGYAASVVEAGLEWLVSRGAITIGHTEGDQWTIHNGGQSAEKVEEKTELLKAQLQESTAFRQHYLRVEHGFLMVNELGKL